MRELLLELSVLVRIRHPNIVTFWGTAANFPVHPQASDKPYIGMVFELCEKSSLYRGLHQNGLGYKLDHKQKMRVLLGNAPSASILIRLFPSTPSPARFISCCTLCICQLRH